VGSIQLAGFVFYWPFKIILDKLTDVAMSETRSRLVSWAPQQKIVSMNVAALFDKRHVPASISLNDVDLVQQHMKQMYDFMAIDVAKSDPVMAAVLLRDHRAILPDTVIAQYEQVVADKGEDPLEVAVVSSIHMSDTDTRVTNDRHHERIAAIKEALEEVKVEEAATLDFSERIYRELTMSNGQANAAVLRSEAERLYNSDVWYIHEGYLRSSALGADPREMAHSAIYLPRADDNGQHMHMVEEHVWSGADPETGQFERRTYKRLAGRDYTGYGLVSDRTLVFNGRAIALALEEALALRHDYSVNLQCGPPGCGKTYAILQQAAVGDAVMCPVRESISDTRARLADQLKVSEKDLKPLVRTVDSFLVNYKGLVMKSPPKKLFADECFMTHAGRWYAVCALLGVREVQGFGDPHQIPHIPRVQVSSLRVQIQGDTTQWTYKIYRCPSVLVAAWAHIYEYKVRTVSQVSGYFKKVPDTRGMAVPKGCVMMAMYQADKLVIKGLYPQHLDHIKILTAHESEGKTYDDVWLHNFEVRRREPNDQFYLFRKQAHCLVAASRSRKGVLYVKRSNDSDMITEWIDKASDSRRRAAVADVATVGKTMEYN